MKREEDRMKKVTKKPKQQSEESAPRSASKLKSSPKAKATMGFAIPMKKGARPFPDDDGDTVMMIMMMLMITVLYCTI